ncbi:MAG: hypothetical protein Q4G03_11490 [Planctomycetia bacterium]|nr:hypothetical protein [Planctomycetia bacterium]
MKSKILKNLTPTEALFEFLAAQIDALRPQFIPRDAVLRPNEMNDCAQRDYYAIVQIEKVEHMPLTETLTMWRFNAKLILCTKLATGVRVLNALANAMIQRLDLSQANGATIRNEFDGKSARALCYCNAVQSVEYRHAAARFQTVLTLECDVYLE